MQCSAEEIAQKRRQALEKLAQKQKSKATVQSRSPKKFDFKIYNSPIKPTSSPKSTASTSHTVKHDAKPYDKLKTPQKFYGLAKVITGKCSLISEKRFCVDMEFQQQAIEIFKSTPSRSYNTKTKHWDFHIKDHNFLMVQLQSLRPNVVVEQLPKFVIDCLNEPKKDCSNIDFSSNLDLELASTLMPFQEEGVRYGIDKNGRCLIADDMGLGKTFQALAIANYYKTDWPLLIVTTSSVKNVWEATVHKYLPSVSLMEVQYMTTGKDYIGDCKILIISHDMMTRYVEKLLERKFGVLIIDESHTLKNGKAKCTKNAIELAKRAQRVILLSGTPALSRPSELYSQLSLIDPKFFGNFYDYSRRYCDGRASNFGWDASGKSNLQELEIILNRRFMIRRTKEDVLKSLPNKVQEIVTLDVKLQEMSEEDRACLNALALKYQRQKGGAKHAALLTFFSETAKIKIPSVCSYILQVLKTKQKFLLFAHHQTMLNAICKVLDKKQVGHIRIDGNSNSEQRKHFVDKFQFNDDCLVAVLSVTAANAGITLTAAQLVLFAELHWNPSILSQAESRAHRIGQLHPVVIKYLLAPGTADDSIWPILQEKQKILGEIGLSKLDAFNDEVSVTKQRLDKVERLTENLDFSFKTDADTLDITSYFKTPTKALTSKDNGSDSKCSSVDVFDDDLEDDVLNSAIDNIDVVIKTKRCVTSDEEVSTSCSAAASFDDGFDDVLNSMDIDFVSR